MSDQARSKGEQQAGDTRPDRHGGSGTRGEGCDEKGVNQRKRKWSEKVFSRMGWRQQSLYGRDFFNTRHKECERNSSMSWKKLDHIINKGAWKPSAKGESI